MNIRLRSWKKNLQMRTKKRSVCAITGFRYWRICSGSLKRHKKGPRRNSEKWRSVHWMQKSKEMMHWIKQPFSDISFMKRHPDWKKNRERIWNYGHSSTAIMKTLLFLLQKQYDAKRLQTTGKKQAEDQAGSPATKGTAGKDRSLHSQLFFFLHLKKRSKTVLLKRLPGPS